MYFDISSKDKAMQFLTEFTRFPQIEIEHFLERNTLIDSICVDTSNVTAEDLIQESGLNPSTLDAASIKALAIHYTSNNDKSTSIRNIGLGDLQYALNNDTPLRRFLDENGISIYADRKLMCYKGKEYDITYTQYDSTSPLTGIARKIYFDNQISCFFRITRYLGRVNRRPEILANLDNFLKGLNLSRKWAQQSQGYEIRYVAPLSEFELYTFYDNRECTYYDNSKIALALIDLALSVVSEYDKDEIFAYMKPTTVITPGQIVSIKSI